MPAIRKLESVNLKFYQKLPNVGDQFSLAAARHFFSPNVVACNETPMTAANLILLGSFLQYADACSYVCGAGFISAEPRYLLKAAPRSVNCVRGPLTGYLMEKQGVRNPEVYGDPGILAPMLYPQSTQPCCRFGIVPHYADADSPWIQRCRQMGLKVIDVLSGPDRFFAEMNQCQVILSSSLHGIIFAHAYGKPAVWIELSDRVIGDGFKFYDYYLSVDVKPRQVRRVRIRGNENPYEVAKLATLQSHAKLHGPLEAAISKTVQQLNRHPSPVMT
jgi:pyruvyltransferase